MTQRSRVLGVALGLLLLSIVLSACGAAPVAENWPGLTLDGDTIYVISGSPQQVYMLDAETGTQKGTFMPQGEHTGVLYWSPVTVGGDLAFVGFAESQAGIAGLYAFDPETGQELWNVPAENLIIPAPSYADGVVYFGDSDGFVYAVEVETQLVKPGWPFQAREPIWASPLVAGGRVYVAAQDHHLYCLDAETGEEVWTVQLGGAMAAEPTLDPAQGILYQGTFDGRVYAIRADSGEIIQPFEFQAGNWIWSQPLVDDDLLYVTALDGKLYALERSDGTVVWSYCTKGEADDCKDVIRASPVQVGESIIAATQAGLVAAVADGRLQRDWPGATPPIAIYTTPVVADGTIYVVLRDGQVYALDAETLVTLPGWPFSPPTGE